MNRKISIAKPKIQTKNLDPNYRSEERGVKCKFSDILEFQHFTGAKVKHIHLYFIAFLYFIFHDKIVG